MDTFIIIFTILVLFNTLMVILSYIYVRKSQDELLCSASVFFSSVAQFLDENGARPFEDILPSGCSERPKSIHIQELEKSFQRKAKECKHIQRLSQAMNFGDEHPLLTLFTSWEPSSEKYFVHNCTLKNWSSFIPKVKLVLFTNNSLLHKEVVQYGWTVFPIIHHVEGVPILKHMFEKVMSSINSTFYGYSNSDILYTDDLIRTLNSVNNSFCDRNVFLTGRRTNIPHLSLKEVVSHDNIRAAAESRGQLFIISSADYFITTSRFHWNRVPELVIGRPAYDNWLVGYARCHSYDVIDLTNTVLACHQTTKSGNKEGQRHKTLTNYNNKLLNKLDLSTHYEIGFMTCPKWKTYHSLCGDIELTKRPVAMVPKYCSCRLW